VTEQGALPGRASLVQDRCVQGVEHRTRNRAGAGGRRI